MSAGNAETVLDRQTMQLSTRSVEICQKFPKAVACRKAACSQYVVFLGCSSVYAVASYEFRFLIFLHSCLALI